MKLITAIVRPDKLDELIGTLVDNQAHGLTVAEVRGFGRQFGQLAAGAGAGLSRVTLLHKIRLDIVALDDDVETLVEAIAKHARTENGRRREDMGYPGRQRPARPDRRAGSFCYIRDDVARPDIRLRPVNIRE